MAPHDHFQLLGAFIQKEWYWITSAVVVLYYSIRWTWDKYMTSDYMERAEVISRLGDVDKKITTVKSELTSTLKEHEAKEFIRADRFEEKIDNLTKIVIENMRDNKK